MENARYVLVVIEFQYDSKKNRFVANDVRQAFLGISPPKYPEGRGSPNIPKKIREKCSYNREIINPIHYSLIKKPVKAEIPGRRIYTIRNIAVGAMILYKYLGLFEDLKNFLNIFESYVRTLIKNKKPIYFSHVTNFELIIGNKWDDILDNEKI